MLIEKEYYKEIIKTTIIECVDLILLNSKNKILLWLRNNNPLKWIYHIPGWRRYKNELLLDSVKRKAYEELWIHICTDKLIFLWIYDDIYPNSMFEWIDSHYSSITYVYHIDKDEENNIKKDKQHSNLKFFDINDKMINDIVQIRIKDMKKNQII